MDFAFYTLIQSGVAEGEQSNDFYSEHIQSKI